VSFICEELQKANGGDPHQPHLGARIHYYRCSLPGLAGFAVYRREGTNADHHRRAKCVWHHNKNEPYLAEQRIMREDTFFDNSGIQIITMNA